MVNINWSFNVNPVDNLDLKDKKLCQTVAEFEAEIQSGTWDKKLLQAAELYLKDTYGEKIIIAEAEKILQSVKEERLLLREIVDFVLEKMPNIQLAELGRKYLTVVDKTGGRWTIETDYHSGIINGDVKEVLENLGIEKSDDACHDLLVKKGIIKNEGLDTHFWDYISQTALNEILKSKIYHNIKNNFLNNEAVKGLIQSYISGEQKVTKETFIYPVFSNMLFDTIYNSKWYTNKILLEFLKIEKDVGKNYLPTIVKEKNSALIQQILKDWEHSIPLAWKTILSELQTELEENEKNNRTKAEDLQWLTSY